MKSLSRGTAMVETAIVLSTVLLILFGTMQIAIWGYSQATTEGAAFIGAHAASINSSGTQSTDQTYGLSVANLAFPKVGSSQFVLTYPTAQPNAIQAIVTNDAVAGLFFVPHTKTNVEVRGGDIEPILSNNSNTGTTSGGVGVQAIMTNYCFFQTKGKTTTSPCQSRSIYIAQYDDIYGKGNGKNGQFAEWNCRPGLFPTWGGNGGNGPAFPTTYPTYGTTTGGGPNSIYDPSSGTFFESSLYAFDTSTSQWGKASSC